MARLLSCHLRCILTLLFFIGHFSWSVAQIKIAGNVYGGGNAGDMTGNTSVTVSAGDIQGNVFGGARQANVGGHAYVDIDGEHMSDNIVINHVYGGNDIAGTVGESIQETDPIPSELTEAVSNEITATAGTNTKQYSAFVLTTPERKVTTTTGTGNNATTTTTQPYHIFIGQVFGGGNGNYDYDSDDSPYKGKTKPDLTKTYLEIKGGTIAYLFGGGNCATVTGATDICIKNTSTVTTDADLSSIIATDRLHAMGLNTVSSHVGSTDYQFNRVFGGNNEVAMAIRPTWHLKEGKIRDLYSGGNAGDMTSPEGILLTVQSKDMKIHNVYGGCRMANVNPAKQTIPALSGYAFPAGYAARVLIDAGDIDNVYGGNDVSGNIYGGNALGIHSSINNDVYGGGNGSYPYTDNTTLKNYDEYKDFYYEPGSSSVDALNAFRPNAEAVSIRVVGTETKPTIIGGALYCGGNSATLRNDDPNKNATAQLKIGSYVIADKVFLGNNGENMVTTEDETDPLRRFAQYVNVDATDGSLALTETGTSKFNSMNLKDATVFAKYMEGCAMRIKPEVVFDDVGTYEPYSTKFGSFYCGGNVGSMIMDGKQAITFKHPVIIFDKLVGGCNTAYVAPTDWNAEYEGGIRGDADTNGDKLQLDLAGLKIQPMRWKMKTVDNKEVYDLDSNGNRQLEWNTFVGGTKNLYTTDNTSLVPSAENAEVDASANDIARRFKGGNIYGGCYESGLVNGNVIINIDGTIIDRDGEHGVFDSVTADEEGEAILYGHEKEGYKITARRSGVILDEQGMDVLGSALNVFGGGYGKDSEIWGSTTINLNKGYVFQIFGGGEQGAIGKGTRNSTTHVLEYKTTNLTEEDEEAYKKYSTYINLHGEVAGVSKGATLTQAQKDNLAEAEFIYGGGFEGLICGDTHVYLGNGRIFNSFAGSCNADILGHTETYVGKGRDANGTVVAGFPWIRDHIYGGNDLGGRIHGSADFSGNVSDFAKTKAYGYSASEPNPSMIASAYMEYTQGRVDRIFGGCYGDYDYSNDFNNADYSFEIYNGSDTHTEGIKYFKPYLHNAFVNFKPNNNSNNLVKKVLGAGQGFSGDRDGDKVQDRSYVLVDIADAINENFKDTEFFGAGAVNGLGMRYSASTTFGENFDLNTASATIDLMRGKVSAAYGGSYEEGITRRTLVNVPKGSTIKTNNIFGGAYGNHILPPCDVYEANVNYRSADARVNGAIYGGNNNVRRTIYSTVNVNVPVLAENGYSGTVYGAGKGLETWAEYTKVNLEPGAKVWEVYGGSEDGNVLNAESVEKYMIAYASKPADKLLEEDDTGWTNPDRWTNGIVGGTGTLTSDYQTEWQKVWKTAWTIGDYYIPTDAFDNYVSNPNTNLTKSDFVREAEIDDRKDTEGTQRYKRYNTNVIISEGATVSNYAYGGGKGKAGEALSGGIFGTTYIALLGGKVEKDIYAACTSGQVVDVFDVGAYDSNSNPKGFTASANAYIQGGSVRNVYGAGWKGNVGSETIDGETHVVIGNKTGTTFTNGIPAILRNAYAGGEGETKDGVTEGSTVFGSANVTLYNGYIGYTYNADGIDDPETPDIDEHYEEKLHDETATDVVVDGIIGKNRLVEAGNIFGSGYVDHSDVDRSYVTVWDGVVRNSLYGGGEIGCVGRGSKSEGTVTITKGGATHVSMYGGLVIGDVFGGGRGYDNLNRVGTLGTAGYVYGTTEVNIHRGRIGTESSVAEGHGNVFGGGNLGYVYSTGTKNTSDGYYYNGSNLTEDCKVVVSPYVVVTKATNIGEQLYAVGDFVPTDVLNTLTAGDSNWKTESGGNFDDLGITIGNAVFAGGNVSAGSDVVYANTPTVFGNATASVTDVFNKDLVAIGGDGVGGLYGDGNLTLVDGYRELNITNYGTDYYNLNSSISYDDYQRLNDRERAYFELQYQAKSAHRYDYYWSTSYHNYGDVTYHRNQKITATDYANLTAEEKANWESGSHDYAAGDKINQENYELMDSDEQSNWNLLGFCTLYAGRIMNTIQRADFCGVFGSRIVLRGAQDRVPSVIDYTNYTINRVDELSLNCVTKSSLTHGNYFGIYSMVNYLGALTSDVKFRSTRTTASKESIYAVDGKTYYEWKSANLNNRKRNNGSSLNEVALSSGVWLEILDKKTETEKKKVYGPITGVVELALINVATGEGGGYVYAKNMHGALISDNATSQVTLSAANEGAVSYKQYTYSDVTTTDKIQTSGNFVSSGKRIVDDCYPKSGSFYGADAAPAHYWYIRGDFYLYDQLISAYTGSAQAYAEQVSIPLTITPESQGRLILKDIRENLYAYWTDNDPNLNNYKSQIEDDAIVINDITYHKNDPISYWDYSRLNDAQKAFFLGKTYVSMEDMELSTGTYTKGQVLTAAEYTAVPENEYVCTTAFTTTSGVEYADGEVLNQTQYNALAEEAKQHFESAKSLVRVSNAVSHDNGFLLSFVWDNPDVWNNYYQHLSTAPEGTPQYVRSSKYDSDEFASSRASYTPSPTFKCNTPGVKGQLNYQMGNLIDQQIYERQSTTLINKLTEEQQAAQAEFEQAYVAKADCDFTVGGVHYYYLAGAPVSKTLYDSFGTNQNLFDVGYICTSTYQVSETEYILNGDVMTSAAYNDLPAEQQAVMSPAYICTKDGDWGGKYFESGANYPAVDFSNLSKAERAHFSYNYDALDLLSENFATDGVSAKKYQGETHGITNQIPYCEKQAIDYTATYSGTSPKELTSSVEVKRGTSTMSTNALQPGDVLTNTVYESLVNEQFHYSPIVVSGADDVNTVYYVVNEGIQVADNWYNVGNKMSEDIYLGLTQEQRNKITPVSRSKLTDLPTGNNTKSYYFCTSPYVAKTKVKDVTNGNTYEVGAEIPIGAIIGPEDNEGYGDLINEHTGFTIDGIIPTETSTLYVSRETDINDLSQDKIVTVEYWYEYVESDETGNSYETIRERHVVNIRIHFKSGVPIISELLPPRTILPGDVLGLRQPTVTKGAYEILGGGWETFSSLADAISHKNGTPYITNQTPMYWYQNGNYVAYYAKTYLGKTYSNPVQFSVANYHDLKKVMEAKEHHYYIDHADVDRDPKIYINDYSADETGSTNGLDLLKKLFDLSVLNNPVTDEETGLITSGEFAGHKPLGELVKGGENLDIILRADLSYTDNPDADDWTSIGSSECFAGTLHGDGHTISGLDHSLFNKLCGDVYNLGVTGSFNGAGIAETGKGYVENCWVKTTATTPAATKPYAVFGDPSDIKDYQVYQVVNSYFCTDNASLYKTSADGTTSGGDRGKVKAMSSTAFYNGEVAYDLNGFYLWKRYNDNAHTSGGSDYKYFVDDTDQDGNSILTLKEDGNYASDASLCSSGYDAKLKYVEHRFADGDFIYAGGNIPEDDDIRLKDDSYYPIWPDDYIFFGQRLNYGQVEGRTHQEHPSSIIKSGVRITADETGNRVYRAPAYFRSSKMGVAHFNPYAVFAKVGYKDMTAIDFTGYNDVNYDYVKGWSQWSKSSQVEQSSGKSDQAYAFYPPLLDEDGLSEFRNIDLTQNLLAYTYDAGKTNDVVNAALPDVAYAELNTAEKPAKYRAVAYADPSSVRGHHVQLSDDGYVATNDHFLVDKQDFDAPIGYQFVEDESAQNHRMWYQRTPDKYVETTWSGEGTSLTRTTTGWEGVSLPFTAEIVTTHQKGEITHFYSGSEQSKNGTETKIGHEYWLREFTAGGETEGNVYKANFNYPSSVSGDDDKEVTNTFLWDYYYEAKNGHNHLDANQDVYQTYYNNSRTYNKYARLMSDTPYIIGFPGDTFYEFDLSGKFSPAHTASWDKYVKDLAKQIITFASEEGTQIGVSDKVTGTAFEGYTFKPSYLNMALEAGTNSYVLSEHGDSYDKVPAASDDDETPVPPTLVEAFRPYFVDTPSGNGAKRRLAERIIFDMSDGSSTFDDNDPRQDEAGGELIFYTKTHLVGVKSTLNKAIDVLIVNTSGQTIGSFTIHGGETVETPVPSTGVYIIRAAGGKYNRKVTIK